MTATLCPYCLALTPGGPCPPCARQHQATHPRHRRAPTPSGWARYPRAYRRNRAAILAPRPPCFWGCGRPATTVDHVQPRSRGGDHSLDNLVPCCASCNSARRDRDADRFASKLGRDLARLIADHERATGRRLARRGRPEGKGE